MVVMSPIHGKRILLGITGSIAAYKAAELLRLLRQAGAEVRVMMTESACEFITPLTMQALSDHPVCARLLDAKAESAMGHIALARWADCIIVAPASASAMARMAQGFADDIVTAVCLAASGPVHLAPAMNRKMWQHPATQANLDKMFRYGVQVHGPDTGEQACGEFGPGCMLAPAQIVSALARSLHSGDLAGLRVMVTAGPTWEPLDPVRYLGNRSSGRMGYALAEAAVEMGGEVCLLSGPVNLAPPDHIALVRVTTAEEMYQAVMADIDRTDIFIAAAAVADYCSACVAPQKIKKKDEVLTLDLIRTPDILQAVTDRKGRPFTVAFAAETESLRKHALAKLHSKGADMICANQVGQGQGIDTEENALTLFWHDGELALETMPKLRLARVLLKQVVLRYHAYVATHQ